MDGYPLDNRSEQQRMKAERGNFGDFEYIAGRVAARLTAERVILQDDNSQDFMPDIRIEYTDEKVGYMEVVTDIDPKYAEMSSLVGKLMNQGRKIPGELQAPRLGRVWFISLSASSNLKEIRQQLPDLLAEVQVCAELFEIVADRETLLSIDSPTVARLLKLGVTDVSSRAVRRSDHEEHQGGVILLYPTGIDGPIDVTWQAVLSWIEKILSSDALENKRRKLFNAGGDERHLFLGISYSTEWSAFFALSDEHDTLPQDPPRLPQEVTHLWIMRAQSPGRCLVWWPSRGWLDTRQHWATD